MNDYERIARVIQYLDAHHAEQPDLALLAERAGLSTFHFHRLFSRWAGVTPKDFLQSLTLAHARQLLQRGSALLDASLDAGLSGPGRLHDLCVTLEGASPGEIKSGGAQWTLVAGFAESPFGACLIAEGPRGLCHLSFVEPGEEANAWAELQSEWPHARWQRNNAAAHRLAARIFTRPKSSEPCPPLRACVAGTAFQLRVWRALLRIPTGTLVNYGTLAAAAGNPGAARAVGTAVGSNHISFLIPCHRVIRETGVVGQYRWGRLRKQAMLAWETAAKPADLTGE